MTPSFGGALLRRRNSSSGVLEKNQDIPPSFPTAFFSVQPRTLRSGNAGRGLCANCGIQHVPVSHSPVCFPSFQFAAFSFPLSSCSAQFPVAGSQFPVPSLQFQLAVPVSGSQFPASSFQSPVDSLQFPASSLQIPVLSFQLPVPAPSANKKEVLLCWNHLTKKSLSNWITKQSCDLSD